ncbi:MAG: hypothetical protein NTZ28_10515 [Nitrospirae bacterium]|nr:hypothetical protein [Nitrospirota bacterium]
MGTTLYIVRQDPNLISSSLFRASDADMDIVFIEQAASLAPSSVQGVVVDRSSTTMTYDDLVGRIFSSEHIIVI